MSNVRHFNDRQREICERALLAGHTSTEAAFAAKMTVSQVLSVREELIEAGHSLPTIRNGKRSRRFDPHAGREA